MNTFWIFEKAFKLPNNNDFDVEFSSTATKIYSLLVENNMKTLRQVFLIVWVSYHRWKITAFCKKKTICDKFKMSN